MSTKKEVDQFLSELTIPKISQRIYSIEEARSLWKEKFRDKIYNELRIKHIQNKIRNKLLGKPSNDDKDILFGKNDISKELDNVGLSNLMSGEFEDDEAGLESREECEEEVVGEETDAESENVSPNMRKGKFKTSKYLEIEAEQSDESFGEEEDEDNVDVSSIVDEQYEDENTAAEVYAGEKKAHDVEVLRKLVRKFQKKKGIAVEEVEKKELEEYSSEDEFFSEVPFEEFEVQKELKVYEAPKEEARVEQKDNLIKFKNLENVVEQLGKKKKFNFR